MVAQYNPAGHAVHAAEPVVARYDPVGQFIHALEPLNEYVPAAQLEQLVETENPVEARYLPEGHDMQLEDPALAW